MSLRPCVGSVLDVCGVTCLSKTHRNATDWRSALSTWGFLGRKCPSDFAPRLLKYYLQDRKEIFTHHRGLQKFLQVKIIRFVFVGSHGVIGAFAESERHQPSRRSIKESEKVQYSLAISHHCSPGCLLLVSVTGLTAQMSLFF